MKNITLNKSLPAISAELTMTTNESPRKEECAVELVSNLHTTSCTTTAPVLDAAQASWPSSRRIPTPSHHISGVSSAKLTEVFQQALPPKVYGTNNQSRGQSSTILTSASAVVTVRGGRRECRDGGASCWTQQAVEEWQAKSLNPSRPARVSVAPPARRAVGGSLQLLTPSTSQASSTTSSTHIPSRGQLSNLGPRK